jgi:membrane-bound metal-dependent hydrolase YbcI (DUF457 family)
VLNRTHSVTGALAAVVVQPPLYALAAVSPVDLGAHGLTLALAAAVGGGAATLPDIDHPNSITSVYLPPATTALSWAVRSLAGGHRKAAHWLSVAPLAGAAVAGLAASGYLSGPRPAAWTTVAVAGLLAGLGLWAARLARHVEAVAAGLALALLAVLLDGPGTAGPPWWLGPVVAAGYAAHIVGDRFFGGTIGHDGRRDRYASLKTGGLVELRLVRPACWAALAGAVAWVLLRG